jgi:ABC-2 type transport system permease protein
MPQKTVETPEQERSEQEQRAVVVSSSGAAAQNTLRNIRLIIGREYKNRVTQRSFIITSMILLVTVFIAAFIPTIVQFIASRTNTQTHVVVVNNAGTIAGLNAVGRKSGEQRCNHVYPLHRLGVGA